MNETLAKGGACALCAGLAIFGVAWAYTEIKELLELRKYEREFKKIEEKWEGKEKTVENLRLENEEMSRLLESMDKWISKS